MVPASHAPKSASTTAAMSQRVHLTTRVNRQRWTSAGNVILHSLFTGQSARTWGVKASARAEPTRSLQRDSLWVPCATQERAIWMKLARAGAGFRLRTASLRRCLVVKCNRMPDFQSTGSQWFNARTSDEEVQERANSPVQKCNSTNISASGNFPTFSWRH